MLKETDGRSCPVTDITENQVKFINTVNPRVLIVGDKPEDNALQKELENKGFDCLRAGTL